MAIENTLCIIKPDAVSKRYIGEIICEFDFNKFRIAGIKGPIHLTLEEAGEFYAEHKGKDFFNRLVEFMSSGDIIVLKLEREQAVKALRDLLGPADPVNDPTSMRHTYGTVLPYNALHGSDSVEAANREIDFFFGENECQLPKRK